jgi:hypothetical protein
MRKSASMTQNNFVGTVGNQRASDIYKVRTKVHIADDQLPFTNVTKYHDKKKQLQRGNSMGQLKPLKQ